MILADSIGVIRDISYQKSFEIAGGAKSIRLDVWVIDESGRTYDVEMQAVNHYGLAQRLRYYQAVIDISSLEKGEHYTQLKDSYILFFCPFDYCNEGLPVYTFKSMCCEDRKIVLADGITKVIINSKGSDRAEDRELKALLEYMNGKEPSSELTEEIEEAVQRIKSDERRRKEYMMLRAIEMDAREDGRIEGMALGKSLGLAEGMQQGAYRTKCETAKNLIEMGLSIETIAKATGLSQAEVAAL